MRDFYLNSVGYLGYVQDGGPVISDGIEQPPPLYSKDYYRVVQGRWYDYEPLRIYALGIPGIDLKNWIFV